MTPRSLLSAFLLVGALLGLIAAPLAQASCASMAMPMQSSMKMDMPCCPDHAPTKDSQKSCPLMAMCMNQTLPQVAVWHVSAPMQLIGELQLPSDAPLTGIDSIPPPRPPRSTV